MLSGVRHVWEREVALAVIEDVASQQELEGAKGSLALCKGKTLLTTEFGPCQWSQVGAGHCRKEQGCREPGKSPAALA